MKRKTGIHWNSETVVKEGCVERFRALIQEQTEAVALTEPRTMEYIVYISDDGRRCQVDQWFADLDAALHHLHGDAVKMIPAIAEVSDFHRLWLYAGSDIEQLTDALEGLGIGDRIIKSFRVGGFERWVYED